MKFLLFLILLNQFMIIEIEGKRCENNRDCAENENEFCREIGDIGKSIFNCERKCETDKDCKDFEWCRPASHGDPAFCEFHL
ncbi:unnamed protein product [Caenorhabditis angaria]|uniref:Uncharacterized protein n=1 Tax=Caenorhabditis angaria TaxID=860376 RepID=A0A9P1MWN4_9PELO|nr:unnamed protein product [Caenorhabditis angaria]